MTDVEVRDEAMTPLPRRPRDHGQRARVDALPPSRHPEVYARAPREVDGALGAATPTLDDLPRLAVRHAACFKEAMRLYPPAFITAGRARDVDTRAVRLPKKITAFVNIYGMHRRAKHLPRSLALRPRSLQPEREKQIQRFVVHPLRRRAARLHRQPVRAASRATSCWPRSRNASPSTPRAVARSSPSRSSRCVPEAACRWRVRRRGGVSARRSAPVRERSGGGEHRRLTVGGWPSASSGIGTTLAESRPGYGVRGSGRGGSAPGRAAKKSSTTAPSGWAGGGRVGESTSDDSGMFRGIGV